MKWTHNKDSQFFQPKSPSFSSAKLQNVHFLIQPQEQEGITRYVV